MNTRTFVFLVCLPALLSVTDVSAQPEQTISGVEFDRRIASQQADVQKLLEAIVSDTSGCFISGPLMPPSDDYPDVYTQVRVVCRDLQSCERSVASLMSDNRLAVTDQRAYLDTAAAQPPGFRGLQLSFIWHDSTLTVTALTVQQVRFLIWAERSLLVDTLAIYRDELTSFAYAVSEYLYGLDLDRDSVAEPSPTTFGLPEAVGLYAPDPEYVIQGYQNYKDFLKANSEIHTDYASGILAFVPGDSLLAVVKEGAPDAAFPNKEAPRLQEEYREFFERGGDPGVMQTLSREGFDTLVPGEYFFAVALDGQVRFGRELPREEVRKIEKETGRQVPRANHAFLFPGEPVLTAGAFFIENGPRLAAVNAQSGHYFYSNVTRTIREDISQYSDYYLSTIGHFFEALDSLGIAYNGVSISKF